MKLVTDGQFWAIRREKGFWRWKRPVYFSFQSYSAWWGPFDVPFGNCWTDEATARMWFARLTGGQ